MGGACVLNFTSICTTAKDIHIRNPISLNSILLQGVVKATTSPVPDWMVYLVFQFLISWIVIWISMWCLYHISWVITPWDQYIPYISKMLIMTSLHIIFTIQELYWHTWKDINFFSTCLVSWNQGFCLCHLYFLTCWLVTNSMILHP